MCLRMSFPNKTNYIIDKFCQDYSINVLILHIIKAHNVLQNAFEMFYVCRAIVRENSKAFW